MTTYTLQKRPTENWYRIAPYVSASNGRTFDLIRYALIVCKADEKPYRFALFDTKSEAQRAAAELFPTYLPKSNSAPIY